MSRFPTHPVVACVGAPYPGDVRSCGVAEPQ